jgi:hypothetical protein
MRSCLSKKGDGDFTKSKLTQLFFTPRFLSVSIAKATITKVMSSDKTIDDGNSGIEDALNTIDTW